MWFMMFLSLSTSPMEVATFIPMENEDLCLSVAEDLNERMMHHFALCAYVVEEDEGSNT